MEIFLIIVVLIVITRYLVWANFYLAKKSRTDIQSPIVLTKEKLLSGITTIDIAHDDFLSIERQLNTIVVGDAVSVRSLLLAFFAWGHVLIQWAPWTWKTSLVKAFSHIVHWSYSRIQCTPDLLPQDVIWNEYLTPWATELHFKKWPLFSHIVHVDEINRTTPKLQSAFLEAMQENAVTAFGKTYDLPKPFFLVATQNPFDAIGTYLLPYAQVDRFLVGISTTALSVQGEINAIKSSSNPAAPLSEKEIVGDYTNEIESISISDELLEYCANCTLWCKKQWYALSIRATKWLVQLGKTLAYLQWHECVSQDDINCVLMPVLKHRIDYLHGSVLSGDDFYAIISWSVQKDDARVW